MSHPWEQRKGETAAAFRAFQVYLGLGPKRTLDSAYAARHRNGNKKVTARRASGTWRGWSSKNRWTERATAWDAFTVAQTRAGFAEALRHEASRTGVETIGEYRKALESLIEIANAIVETLRKKLDGAKGIEYAGLKDDAATLKCAGEILGRANRDLLLILGGPSLEPDDEPSSRDTPEPVNLRPKEPEEAIN